MPSEFIRSEIILRWGPDYTRSGRDACSEAVTYANRWSKNRSQGGRMIVRSGHSPGLVVGGRFPLSAEFSVAGSHRYDHSGPIRWLLSHLARHKWLAIFALIGMVTQNGLNSVIQWMIGNTFDTLLEENPDSNDILRLSIVILVIVLARSALDLVASLLAEMTGQRMGRDIRDELYLSLLGKSQTFHNRQRVGDLMARANNDVRQMNDDDRARLRR